MKYTRSVSVNWLVILVILHVHQANLPHKFAGCYVTGYGIVALCKVVHKTCLAGIESNNLTIVWPKIIGGRMQNVRGAFQGEQCGTSLVCL